MHEYHFFGARVSADPVASGRLEQLRSVSLIVGEEPAPATPQRRQSSIAAALAAAESQNDDDVASLTAARQKRDERVFTPDFQTSEPSRRPWLAIAAAVVLFALAIPVVNALRPSDTADLATTDTAAESADAAAAPADDDGADFGDDEDAEDAAMDEEAAVDLPKTTTTVAAEASVGEVAQGVSDDSAEESLDAGDDASDAASNAEDQPLSVFEQQRAQNLLPVATSSTEIDALIQSGAIEADFTVDDLIAGGVNATCLENDTDLFPSQFGAVTLQPADGSPTQIVIVRFVDDGTTELFDAETCASAR